jgi:hypothetical protein
VIQDGKNSGEFDISIDAEAVAASLVGAWDALFLQAWFDRSFKLAETAQSFLAVVLRGLKKIK